MNLIMTLLVRDEEDIIRENIEYHLSHGVDFIIATDNGSWDGTRNILAEFEKLGVVKVLDEPGRDHSQWKWVTRMALMARDEFHADWIINNDADEFWVAPQGNLKEFVTEFGQTLEANIIDCQRKNMVYAFDEETNSSWQDRLIYRTTAPVPIPKLADRINDMLPCPYYFLALPPKCMVRAKGLKMIEQGNHSARYEKKSITQASDIEIFHFPIRSSKQLEKKVIQGSNACLNNRELPKNTCWHWHRWANKLQNEGIEAVLMDALPSANKLRQKQKTGEVCLDFTIRDLLKKT